MYKSKEIYSSFHDLNAKSFVNMYSFIPKVCRVPYVQLMSHPTWNSRTSSWTLSVSLPQSILHVGDKTLNSAQNVKAHFRTKVMVNDDCIKVEGEGAPNVVGLFKGTSASIRSINRYDCELADLPVILLQQVSCCFKQLKSIVLLLFNGNWATPYASLILNGFS